MNDNKHKNYELLNLIGYGLAKFNEGFVEAFDFKTKVSFYEYIVTLGIAETIGTVKNRQDLFDPFYDNGRKGWWQKGNAYIHRKELIYSLYGAYNNKQYSEIVKLYIESEFGDSDSLADLSPVIKSKYKQMQITGNEAEMFFMREYQSVEAFEKGTLEDARMFGDGYDFQIQVAKTFFLAEIKGIRKTYGSVRLTNNEYLKAKEYKEVYGLVVVSNLDDIPKMTTLFNPLDNITLTKRVVNHRQVNYHSDSISW